MAKSWASVVRGSESKPQPVSKLNPLAVEWKPREVHHCVDCGEHAQLCSNGCDRPGNRSIVPRLGVNRHGERLWGEPMWVCAGCHYDHERAISQMPYMDMGPLPDADREHKLPFLCVSCSGVREAKKRAEEHERYIRWKEAEQKRHRELQARLAGEKAAEREKTAERKKQAYDTAYAETIGIWLESQGY